MAGCTGVRGVPVVQDVLWGPRMVLGRRPLLSALTQAVTYKPGEPDRRMAPRGLEGLEWGKHVTELDSVW